MTSFRKLQVTSAITLGLTLVGCATRHFGDSSTHMIGGEPAAPGQYPGVMQIEGNCTAAQVSRRHILTAAHCVVNQRVGQKAELVWNRGYRLRISYDVKPNGNFATIPVAQVIVHPSYLNYRYGVDDPDAVSDVALIELESPLPRQDILPVSFAPMTVGTPVILTGYGCEQDEFGGSSDSGNRLKSGTRRVSVVRAETYSTDRQDSNGVVVQGCRGDSGGPVLRRTTQNGYAVVGVNSFILETKTESNFARFDQGVARWLPSVAPDVAVFNGSFADGSTTQPTNPTQPTKPKPVEPTKPNPGSGSLPFSGEFISFQQAKCSSLMEDFGQQASDPKLKTSPCHLRLIVNASGVTAEALTFSGTPYRMTVSPNVRNNAVVLTVEGKEIVFQKEASGKLGVHGSQFIDTMNPVEQTRPNPVEPTKPKPVEPTKPNPGSGSLPFSGDFISFHQAKCSSLMEDFGQQASDPQLQTSPCHLHLIVNASGVTAEALTFSGTPYRMTVSPSVRNDAVVLTVGGKEIVFQKEASGNLGVHGSMYIYLMNPKH